MQTHLILLAVILIGFVPVLNAASLFDEEKKDAASSVVMDVEKDRPVTVEENRRYVQAQPDYVKSKLKEFDDKLSKINSRIEKLESEVKSLTETKR